MFIVGRGVAEILVKGNRTDIRTVEVGGYFGEQQVLGILSRRHETVRAKTSLQLFEVTANALTKLLRRTHAEEDAEHGFGADTSLWKKRAERGQTSFQCLYQEERRHFESEAVRMYKVMSGDTVEAFKPCGSDVDVDIVSKQKPVTVAKRRDSMVSRKQEIAQAQLHDNLMTKLVESIRCDMRNGCMMPSNFRDRFSRKGSRKSISGLDVAWSTTSGAGSSCATTTPNASRMSCSTFGTSFAGDSSTRASANTSRFSHAGSASTVTHTRASCRHLSVDLDIEKVDEGTYATDILEVECLPELDDIAPAQKHSILAHLKAQMKARLWKSGPTTRRAGIKHEETLPAFQRMLNVSRVSSAPVDVNLDRCFSAMDARPHTAD